MFVVYLVYRSGEPQLPEVASFQENIFSKKTVIRKGAWHIKTFENFRGLHVEKEESQTGEKLNLNL